MSYAGRSQQLDTFIVPETTAVHGTGRGPIMSAKNIPGDKVRGRIAGSYHVGTQKVTFLFVSKPLLSQACYRQTSRVVGYVDALSAMEKGTHTQHKLLLLVNMHISF